MKLTDQIELDYFQAELASGRANRSEISDTDDLKAASALIAALLIGALLMVWLGR